MLHVIYLDDTKNVQKNIATERKIEKNCSNYFNEKRNNKSSKKVLGLKDRDIDDNYLKMKEIQ